VRGSADGHLVDHGGGTFDSHFAAAGSSFPFIWHYGPTMISTAYVSQRLLSQKVTDKLYSFRINLIKIYLDNIQ
jgi:hypothetical protein